MNKFKKRFLYMVEAGMPAMPGMPAEGNPEQLTNDASLQASLDATQQSGQIAAGNDPFDALMEKLPMYQQYTQQISELVKSMLEDIEAYAGEPGTASVWNELSKDLRQILSTAGFLSGKINGLPSEIKVKRQAILKQKTNN